MPLNKSISGIRGTIGGAPGNNLTPLDIIKFSAGYGNFVKKNFPNIKVKIIIGRDSRLSGEMLKNLVVGTLIGQGIDIIDLGLASTPTVEMTVIGQKAQGGIILSASHNPQGWNALKLIDSHGEFFSPEEGKEILALAAAEDWEFATEDKLGVYVSNPSLFGNHIKEILNLPLVDKNFIAAKNFKVVVDGINSVGGLAVPELLRNLGITEIIELNCVPSGLFAHKPEPLIENLAQIGVAVKENKADLGIVVDPDVDRLAFVAETGEVISEEYTIVAIADYVLKNFAAIDKISPGKYQKTTVTNLSSSRALKDVAEKYQGTYEPSAVGEFNVVKKMKEIKSVIGGEGNGGVVYPQSHYGRDALVGIALFLSALAQADKKMSEFMKSFPEYFMVKDKVELTPAIDLLGLLNQIKDDFRAEKITDIDGVRIDWADSWVHLRASNTEPVIRVYAEAKTPSLAQAKAAEFKDKILAYIK